MARPPSGVHLRERNAMTTAMAREHKSYRDLGFLTNFDPGYLWKIATGERAPSRAAALEIAKALNVPVDGLWVKTP